MAQRGPGGILADLARSQSASGRGTLYLVSPGGHRYRLGAAPVDATLEDWSGSGTSALFFANAARTVLGGRAWGGYVTGAVLFPAS